VSKSWRVLKFGGSSVSGKWQWETIAALLRRRLDDGHRVVIVCSAVAGVTNALQALADGSGKTRDGQVAEILERHRQLAQALGVESQDLLLQAREDVRSALQSLSGAATAGAAYAALASLLPIGEWLSTCIGERYLAQALEIEWVDARLALETLPEANPNGRRAWLSARCDSRPSERLQHDWASKKPALITPGFVAQHHRGGTALLGRGGSDTSAALLAGRLEADRVEIWTDVNGLFSADPRLVPSARLLRTLAYDEALEMAASGARVVHSRCIRAAADASIPIEIRDLARPDARGTCICAPPASAAGAMQPVAGIRSVCLRSDMAVLLLRNLDTREHVGFLAWVFSCIAEAGVSIDLVATSETTTTVALNRTSNVLDDALLEQLAELLRARCAVTVYPECSAINLVGRGARVALAGLDPGASFFARHRLLMLSQSANDLCTSIVVMAEDAQALLEDLHGRLIGNGSGDERHGAVFGPARREQA
jgi:diaminopimelate decarboxylase/aspartate kinase